MGGRGDPGKEASRLNPVGGCPMADDQTEKLDKITKMLTEANEKLDQIKKIVEGPIKALGDSLAQTKEAVRSVLIAEGWKPKGS
jgi:hypothetical protein